MHDASYPNRLRIVDSHTEGEPTRMVIDGWPTLESATMADRREEVAGRFGELHRAVVREPRGFDAMVGALLTPPVTNGAVVGVVFFNNVGTLGMCGHGLIGVVRSLEFLRRVVPGALRIDTPVGLVGAELHADGAVTIENVPSRCHRTDVAVDVPGFGRVTGDVAYGGNWFFLTHVDTEVVALENVDRLTSLTNAIKAALARDGIRGDADAEIDHVEIFGPPSTSRADSRNFVLCPGGEFDRSPCGTGTSAKMAALHARGELAIGQRWRQESITGSLFTGWLEGRGSALIPRVQGRAFVTSEGTLYFDAADPFRTGFSARSAPVGGR